MQAKNSIGLLVNLAMLPIIPIEEECVCEVDFWDSWSVQLFRSIDNFSAVMENIEPIDKSIQMAYLHHIRRAKRFIFIENQYFIGSSQAWEGQPSKSCPNLIPLELAMRIVKAIQNDEPFGVYVILPLYPEGVPTDGAVQEILYWQYKTIEMMYSRIQTELVKSGKYGKVRLEDYLNFYCLGKREVSDRKGQPFDVVTRPYQEALNISRRFAIYVHSKMMIVDDDYIIIGSANINERSMSGDRDTEIAVGAYQPHFTSDNSSGKPRGDIHAFRLSLWSSHTRKMLPCFLQPESAQCARTLNEIGRKNWEIFAGDIVANMDENGQLMKYPLDISDNGKVMALPGKSLIPDTKASIMGTESALIPDTLTQ